MRVINTNNVKTNVFLNSISIALLISMNFIAGVIKINGGIFIIALSIITIQLYSRKAFSIPIKSVLIILYILSIFLVSFLVNKNNYYAFDSMSKFIIFGIIPIYLSTCDFDEKLVFKTILLIGFISLPLLTTMSYYDISSEYKMGLSYAILPVFFVAVILTSEKIIYKTIGLITIIACLLIILDIGSRGAIVSIIIFLSMFIITKTIRKISYKYILLSLFSITFPIFIGNIWSIFSWLQFTLMKYNVSIYALDKTILYYGQDKLYNFRDYLWMTAIDGLKDSFILGKGIGSFQLIHGTYVHNVFIQTLWEGGLFLFIPFMVIFLLSVKTIIHSSFTDRNIFLIYLLSLSFFSLLFSSVFWMNQNLWLLIGLVLHNYLKSSNNNSHKNVLICSLNNLRS